MTKWDIYHGFGYRVHPGWDMPLATPFFDHSHSTWLIEGFEFEDRVKNKLKTNKQPENWWYCLEKVQYRNGFSAIIQSSPQQENKLKHFKNVFIFGNTLLARQQSHLKSSYLLKEQDPTTMEKSSIAMPPDPLFPAEASNVTCQRNNIKAAIMPKSLCCIILRAAGVINHLKNQVQ